LKILFAEDNSLQEGSMKIITNSMQKPLWNEISDVLSTLGDVLTVIDAQSDRTVPIPINDVMLIESEGRMCNVKTKQGSLFLLNMRLKVFEEKNRANQFVRINNQAIINLHLVKSFRASENARLEVGMADGATYYVNRYFVKLFKEKFKL